MKTKTEYSQERRKRLEEDGIKEIRGLEAPIDLHDEIKRHVRSKWNAARHTVRKGKE